MISKLIKKLEEKTDLSYDEVNVVMIDILSGKTTDAENVSFLSTLAEKGETDDELLGMLDKMNEFALKVVPKNQGTIIDMCGTGGDKLQTQHINNSIFCSCRSRGNCCKTWKQVKFWNFRKRRYF